MPMAETGRSATPDKQRRWGVQGREVAAVSVVALRCGTLDGALSRRQAARCADILATPLTWMMPSAFGWA